MKKRFRFSLERVLSVRRLEERLCQAELLLARSRFHAAEEALLRTRKEIDEGIGEIGGLRRLSPIPLADCLVAEAAVEGLRAVEAGRSTALETKRREIENARQIYFAAATRRKAIERLRETRRAIHQKEVTAAENALFDEIAGARAAGRREFADQEER